MVKYLLAKLRTYQTNSLIELLGVNMSNGNCKKKEKFEDIWNHNGISKMEFNPLFLLLSKNFVLKSIFSNFILKSNYRQTKWLTVISPGNNKII